MITAVNGKVRVLPVPWCVREVSHSGETTSPTPSLLTLLDDPDAADQIDRFLGSAIVHLMNRADVPQGDARTSVGSALDVYLNRYLPRLHRHRLLPAVERAARSLTHRGYPSDDHEDLVAIRAALLGAVVQA
jgi:hypothetical protein